METNWHKQIKTLVNTTILTMNKEMQVLENAYLKIDGKRIAEIGQGEPENPVNPIDLEGQLVIPGFINAHTHLSMTLYRGIADDLPLHDWLENHIWPAETKCSNEKNIRMGAQLGLAEMIKTGTTTFSDMYFFADAVAEETTKAGLCGVMGEAILEFPTNSYNSAAKALQKTEDFVLRWKDHPLIKPAIICHSTYTCSKETLLASKKLADKYQITFATHVSETQEEIEMVTKEQGLNPVKYLNKLELLNNRFLGAHGVWLNEEDQKVIQETKANLVHCPSSNLKLGSGIAPLPELLSQGVNVALGTDGCASNNNLDMVEEMRLAALIHKGNRHNPTVVTDKEALAMATINGAKALGLEEQTGSIEVGKLADLQIIDLNNNFMIPLYDYYSAIVYSMNSTCIQSVISQGKPLMLNRELQTLDENAIYKHFKKWKACY